MKTPMMIFSMCAAVALLGLGVLNAAPAQAAMPTGAIERAVLESSLGAAKFQTNLTWDGGATGISQVACLTSAQQTILLDPVRSTALPNGTEFCYKVCATSTCVPDCTKDRVLNKPLVSYQTPDSGVSQSGFTTFNPPAPIDRVEMGLDKCVVVSSLDAGNPNVNLYLVTKNL